MAPTPIVNFRLPPGLLERIDAARGDESRTAWIVRAAEAQLDGGPARDREVPAVAVARPAVSTSAAAKAGVLPR